jgi:hypothetical protein
MYFCLYLSVQAGKLYLDSPEESELALKYNNAQHRVYLELMDRVSDNWLLVFDGNTEFFSAAYWDLLRGIWRQSGPIRKTDAMAFMRSVKSAHTAGKLIDAAIREGFLIEHENPKDARSKLLGLSEPTRLRIDEVFDMAVTEIRNAEQYIITKGPVS